MYTINELLDIAKEKNPDLTSDRRLAIKLGITDLSHYRKRNVAPNDATAAGLAELCGLAPEVVIAACHAAKAETPATRRAWKNIYKLAVNACIAVTVAWVLHVTQGGVNADTAMVSMAFMTGSMDIMLSLVCAVVMIYTIKQHNFRLMI